MTAHSLDYQSRLHSSRYIYQHPIAKKGGKVEKNDRKKKRRVSMLIACNS